MTTLGPDHYRYYATLEETGVRINCERFIVIGETECCYYVIREDRRYLIDTDWSTASPWRKKLRKRVLKASHGRRYCYPDKAKALESFRIRQVHRKQYAQRSLSIAELSGKEAERLLAAGQLPDARRSHLCGHDAYTSSLNWADC